MKDKPRLVLDLYCGAGGASMGYHQAWPNAQIIGVDHEPQPKYPFEFVCQDVIHFLVNGGVKGVPFIHASPPCQAFSSITRTAKTQANHPDLIGLTRELLSGLDAFVPYVIENVPGAPLRGTILLCGTMFGLNIVRHRIFETRPSILATPSSCNHEKRVVKHGRKPNRNTNYAAVTGHFSDVEFAQEAMGIDWMGQKELAQAIPPAYTKFLGPRVYDAWIWRGRRLGLS